MHLQMVAVFPLSCHVIFFPSELHPIPQKNHACLVSWPNFHPGAWTKTFQTKLVAMENLMQRFPEKKPLGFVSLWGLPGLPSIEQTYPR